MLDHASYPHIIDLIIGFSSPKVHRALRLCSHDMNNRVAKLSARHICIYASPFHLEPLHYPPSIDCDGFPTPIPGMQCSSPSYDNAKQLLRLTKALDLIEWAEWRTHWTAPLSSLWTHLLDPTNLPNLQIVRRLNSDCPVVSPRLVDFNFLNEEDVPHGCEVYVLNTRYADINPDYFPMVHAGIPYRVPKLPSSVQQVVFHLDITTGGDCVSEFEFETFATGMLKYICDNSGPTDEDESRKWTVVGPESEPKCPGEWKRYMHSKTMACFSRYRPGWADNWTSEDALWLATRIGWKTAEEYRIEVGEWLYGMETAMGW